MKGQIVASPFLTRQTHTPPLFLFYGFCTIHFFSVHVYASCLSRDVCRVLHCAVDQHPHSSARWPPTSAQACGRTLCAIGRASALPPVWSRRATRSLRLFAARYRNVRHKSHPCPALADKIRGHDFCHTRAGNTLLKFSAQRPSFVTIQHTSSPPPRPSPAGGGSKNTAVGGGDSQLLLPAGGGWEGAE